eukprot:1696513-Rhodomonas_salina.1
MLCALTASWDTDSALALQFDECTLCTRTAKRHRMLTLTSNVAGVIEHCDTDVDRAQSRTPTAPLRSPRPSQYTSARSSRCEAWLPRCAAARSASPAPTRALRNARYAVSYQLQGCRISWAHAATCPVWV